MFKHLLIISDGEVHENTLHLTDRSRAQALLDLIKNRAIRGVRHRDVDDAITEADDEAAGADYAEGNYPQPMEPEDYLDTIKECLAEQGVDVYIDDLPAPEEAGAAQTTSTDDAQEGADDA